MSNSANSCACLGWDGFSLIKSSTSLIDTSSTPSGFGGSQPSSLAFVTRSSKE